MKFEDVTIHVEVIKETDRAWLIQLEDGEESWIPKSQVLDGEMEDGDVGDITITGWFANSKGWI